MSTVPEDRRYTRDHEWARKEEGGVRMGITDYAQNALGDVVFVKLPEAGSKAQAGTVLSEVESTKSVSDVYAPVTGTVTTVNSALADSPQTLNDDPYGEGWICVIAPEDPTAYDFLLEPPAYRELIS